jgi:hypothetical protein
MATAGSLVKGLLPACHFPLYDDKAFNCLQAGQAAEKVLGLVRQEIQAAEAR